ncbi:iron-hydroxamate transporter permease subunit [Actinocatenispora thailandica]|uniref:Iron-hydroxamate transporter permease subunit n=1 Tax=Actinocatenispora thailandica TaxID=227318 RepID=A0A7R7DVC1_9ACTN|nr:iron ABC transporter permease [Actinocatenispora thailandica]BCJ38476.1 iron-hydroxamate transporter permease subunit [Actinocatenispora thailandica]
MTAAIATPPAVRRPVPPAGRYRIAIVAAVGVVLLVALAIVHLGQGSAGIGLSRLLSLAAGHTDPDALAVLRGSRLPRLTAGLVTGLALGISGALIQGATRNPLAAPDTLGVNAGGYLAVSICTLSGVQLGILPSAAVAFAGGLVAAGLVQLLTAGGPVAPGRMLLAGTAVAMAGSSAATVLLILHAQRAQGLFFWGNGSLLETGLTRPLLLGLIVLLAAAVTPLLARPLDLLALGDDTAEALGLRVGRIRLSAFALAVLFSAVSVALTGPIGFVGLVAPVVVRLFGVRRHAALLPIAGVYGAVFVLGADVVARALLAASGASSYEIPAGVVTALVGGPIFVYLARRVPTGDADTGAAVTVSAPRSRRRYALIVAGGVVALALAVLAGLAVGDVHLSVGKLLAATVGQSDALSNGIVAFRAPRIVAAALAGACLAGAGVAIQSVVRNPLAEPSLLGVTGGSAIGAVALITLVPTAPRWGIPAAALVGGVLALGLVMLLATRRRTKVADPTRVVLVGIGLAAATSALVQVLSLRAQLQLAAALTWLAGSTYARSASDLTWFVLPALVLAALIAASRVLDLLGLGDDLPRALGLPTGRARLAVLLGGAVLAAGTAAVVGTVGFVGLIAPHLARRLVGSAHRRLLPVAALLGAVLVVGADALGRYVLAPNEIPVGIVTALAGAPYLIWLLRRQRRAS